jgi:hypothetical protein
MTFPSLLLRHFVARTPQNRQEAAAKPKFSLWSVPIFDEISTSYPVRQMIRKLPSAGTFSLVALPNALQKS